MLRWMTEGVYLLVLANPGMSEQEIFDRFNPAVEPFVVLELLEHLQDLGCLKRNTIILAKKDVIGAFASPKRKIPYNPE